MTLKDVNEEQPLVEEAVSEKVVSEEKPEEQPAPAFSEEQEARIQKMLSDAVSEATNKAVDAGRRQLQSEQDRNKTERRGRELAESRVKAYEAGFGTLDEETKRDAELARYREQDKYYQSQAQEEAQRQQQEAYFRELDQSTQDHIRNLGIDSGDTRIDWAKDEPDYLKGRSRLDTSIAKIISEDRKKAEETLRAEVLAEVEKRDAKNRIDLGLESVNTEQGAGGNTSDDAFVQGMTDGTLPLTPENEARLQKIQGI